MENFVSYSSDFNLKNESKNAFVFLDENLNTKQSITYSELHCKVDALYKKIPYSDFPVLLLFEEVSEFILAFLACQKAGLISIPMFYPKSKRHFQRLNDIIIDSGTSIILCEEKNKEKIQKGIINKNATIFSISELEKSTIETGFYIDNPVTFIQYTSGSTSSPKGVVVSMENLISNQEMLKATFNCSSESIIFSWLPFYHDMGLIGSILHSIYVGATCFLMPSVVAIQSPFTWLNAISKFKVTHSGGPNFIYDLCVNQIDEARLKLLDLSHWKVAYNGSEPIKKSTIDSFINKFKVSGFDPSSYYTCYGLAEATLLVSGGKYIEQSYSKISSGKICDDVEVCIYDEDVKQKSFDKGEICLRGKSVTKGYWKRGNNELFVEIDGKQFLKTGDIGILVKGELIVTGRSKEVIIVNGKNYFPYDIENSLTETINQLDENGVIVSFINDELVERPIVFAEIKKAALSEINIKQIFDTIDQLIIELVGIETYDILLFSPRKLHRTSSGKLQRIRTKENYLNKELDFLYSKKLNHTEDKLSQNSTLIDLILNQRDFDLVKKYLIEVYDNKLKITLSEENYDQNLLDLGIDSLKSVDLVNTINKDLQLNIDVTALMNLNTTVDFEEFVKNLIWMKSTQSNTEEIII